MEKGNEEGECEEGAFRWCSIQLLLPTGASPTESDDCLGVRPCLLFTNQKRTGTAIDGRVEFVRNKEVRSHLPL
jgi:hypothetical protein